MAPAGGSASPATSKAHPKMHIAVEVMSWMRELRFMMCGIKGLVEVNNEYLLFVNNYPKLTKM